jgi:D-alanyl-D-alanine dipeptidase
MSRDPRIDTPMPRLQQPAGWRDIPISPVDEPLVPVADLGPRVIEDPRYVAMGLPGALPGCWVREGLAERLVKAAATLPDGMLLVVWDGWRSIETQSALFEAYVADLAGQYPDLERAELEQVARPYVTPPDPGHHAPPPHLTGGAVDLTLATADGREMDLGTGFDAFVPEAGAAALEDIDMPARGNRRLLFHALTAQGLTAYVEEWWHFDFGNQFWASVTGGAPRYGPAGDPSRA